MSLYPIFAVRTLLLLVLPVFLAAVILAAAGKRGISVFKKQGVAWGITLLMVFAAIGIGYAKAPVNNPQPDSVPAPPNDNYQQEPETVPNSADIFVRDDAGVLSSRTEDTLNERNDRLWSEYQVSIGVVTCNYGRDDLGDYAMKCAEEMGLGGYDMIVALDIGGDNYWLIQGDKLTRDFTDADCADYAYDDMEEWFAAGDYDFAVCQLTEMLELWYGAYYG